MKKATIVWLATTFLLIFSSLHAANLHYTLSNKGMPEISLNGKTLLKASTPFWGNNWKWASLKSHPDDNDPYHWVSKCNSNLYFTTNTHWDMNQKNKIVGHFDFLVSKTVSPATGGGFAFRIPLKDLKKNGGASNPILLGNRGWKWQFAKDKYIKVTFEPELPLIYFDRAKKSQIRCMVFSKSVPEGLTSLTMTIEMPAGSTKQPSIIEQYGKTDFQNWFRNPLHPTKSFIDLSYLNHKPAGKYGFIATSGDHFIRGDGETIKFWGCNIQAYTLFMKNRDLIKAHAKRIAALGFNLVRLHHMDSQSWVKNCLIKNGNTSQVLNQEALDTYFYWIKCLKDEGIYLWIDLHVGRLFKKGDIIPGFDELLNKKSRKRGIGAGINGFCYVNDRIKKLMQQFNEKLVTTVNPYTNLALINDPAIMTFTLTNENDLTHHYGNKLLANKNVPFHNQLFQKKADAFIERIQNNSYQKTSAQNEFTSARIQQTWLPGVSKIFLSDVEYQWNLDMITHLRTLGVKQPIDTTQMWGNNPLSSIPALTAGDMIDVHAYSNGEFLTRNPRGAANASDYIARSQVIGMPLTITEWNTEVKVKAQDKFVYPAIIGAMSAFQGWDAPILYGYSQDSLRYGKVNEWSSHNIPNIIGIMPSIALMYRQQHVAEAKQTFIAKLNKQTLFTEKQGSPQTAFSTLSLMHKVAIALPEIKELPWLQASKIPSNATVFQDLQKDFTPKGQDYLISDTGQLRRDWKKGIFTIDTPKTQAAVGWLKNAGSIKLQDVSFKISTPKAAVVVTSLDNKPITNSGKILITAVGRIQIQKEKKSLITFSEPVTGQLILKSNANRMILSPLNNDGSEQSGVILTKTGNEPFIILLPNDKNTHWFLLKPTT